MPRSSRLANAIGVVGLQLFLVCSFSQAQVIVPVRGDIGVVSSMVSVGGEMWIGSENGVFRVDKATNQVFSVRGKAGPVTGKLVVSSNEIFVPSFTNGAFRINPKTNEAIRIEGKYDGAITCILSANGDMWFGGTKGAYRVPAGSNNLVTLDGDPGRVAFIVFEGGNIWVGGTNDTFRVDERANKLISLRANPGYALSMYSYNGDLWLGSGKDASRMAFGTSLIASVSAWTKERLLS